MRTYPKPKSRQRSTDETTRRPRGIVSSERVSSKDPARWGRGGSPPLHPFDDRCPPSDSTRAKPQSAECSLNERGRTFLTSNFFPLLSFPFFAAAPSGFFLITGFTSTASDVEAEGSTSISLIVERGRR